MKKSIWISLAAFAIFVAGALAAIAIYISRNGSRLIVTMNMTIMISISMRTKMPRMNTAVNAPLMMTHRSRL